MNFILIIIFVLPLLVIAAGLLDLTTMKIPNRLNIAVLLSYFPVALLSGLDLKVIGLSCLIALGILVIGMVMFALRWLGGGDAKLFAAVALWMGPQGVLPFLILTAILGGLFCLIVISARGTLHVYRARLPGWGQRLLEPKGDIPYGVAIAAGALWAYPSSDIVLKFINI